MTNSPASPARALLVIDVQESFRSSARWAGASDPKVYEKVERLVRLARAAGDLVVWVLHAEPGSGGAFDPASGLVRVFDELSISEGEPTLHKSSHNAFSTTNLQQLLTMHGVGALTVCGIRTEQCVETTTRVASDFGYQVTFVTDATATEPLPHRDLPEDASLDQILADPRTLSAADVIRHTEYALAHRFARIATVAELEAEAAG